MGYNEAEGVVINDDYKRLNASLSLTPKFLDDHLSVTLNAKYIHVDKNAIDGDGAVSGFCPTKPTHDNNSIFNGLYNQIGSECSNVLQCVNGETLNFSTIKTKSTS